MCHGSNFDVFGYRGLHHHHHQSKPPKRTIFFSLFQDQFLGILESLMKEKESVQAWEKNTKEESEELLVSITITENGTITRTRIWGWGVGGGRGNLNVNCRRFKMT